MSKVISVKFRRSGRAYYFDPGEFEISAGDGVIVETSRGEEYGDVIEGIRDVAENAIVQPLKPVLRVATEEDTRLRKQYIAAESDAFVTCQSKIAEHKLDMKLVDVEYSYNGSKVVFYFTADERVDFRDLVKDLAYALRTRIELRQIGVRDEAKMLGGLGPCGRPVCCNAFLDDFRPVSIKMAKEQSLSLSPTKISGLCGRLMCCLAYEQNAYEEAHKRMPRVGKETETPEGTGIVVESNAITERVKVRLTQEDGTMVIKEFAATETGALCCPAAKCPLKREEPDDETDGTGAQPEAVNDNAAAPAEEQKADRPARDRSRRNRGEKREQNSEAKPERKQEPAPKAKPAPKDTAAEGDKEAEPAKEHSGRRRRHRGGRSGGNGAPAENGSTAPAQNAGEKKPENGRNRRPENGGKKPENGERKPQQNGEKKPQQNGGRRQQDSSSGKPQNGERKPQQNAGNKKPETADSKSGITRLPGETIGMKHDDAAAAPAAPAFTGKGRAHRRHSFGK